MKPEVVSSTKHFCLSAPLRNSSCSNQHKLFFELCRWYVISIYEFWSCINSYCNEFIYRFEATNNDALVGRSGNDSSELCYELGLRWSAEENRVIWVTGKGTNVLFYFFPLDSIHKSYFTSLFRVELWKSGTGGCEASLRLSQRSTAFGHLCQPKQLQANGIDGSSDSQNPDRTLQPFPTCLQSCWRGSQIWSLRQKGQRSVQPVGRACIHHQRLLWPLRHTHW